MKNEYEIRGEWTVIFIKRKSGEIYECLVDTEDLTPLIEAGGSWCIDMPYDVKDHYARKPYAVRSITREDGSKTHVKMHRVLTSAPSGSIVDHINGNTLDNRKCNLRVVDNFINMQNLAGPSRNSKSQVLNVYFSQTDKIWIAAVLRNGVYMRAKRKDFEEAVSVAEEMRSGTWVPRKRGNPKICS